MKTTVKPAGPVEFEKSRRVVEEIDDPFRTICDFTYSEFPVDAEDQHGEFIADAFNVFHETGLTPRAILAQRDALMEIVARVRFMADCHEPSETTLAQIYDETSGAIEIQNTTPEPVTP